MSPYSAHTRSLEILQGLISDPALPILPQARERALDAVELVNDSNQPLIPIVYPAHEAFAALKGLEGALAIALLRQRFGEEKEVKATVDIKHAALFPAMSFLSTVDGLHKWDSEMKTKIKDTDLNKVYSNIYRRMISNIYRTKDNRFYHLHTSLDATPTLEILGLPPYDDSRNERQAAQTIIEEHARMFTSDELDTMIRARRLSGSPCLTREEFLATAHGAYISSQPLFDLRQLESSSPPLTPSSEGPNILSGIKILDLTRVIAGPVITRTLAEYGAQILRVTNLNLPDQSYYAVDFNFGKRTLNLDLKSDQGRKDFEGLLEEVDVIVDGYRPGALQKLGYGPDELMKRFGGKRGFVYVKESCYGDGGEWSNRPGWQQIADSVTGLSWTNGRTLGMDEPVAPPFPFADFGTGELGCIAALNALHHRMIKGGSYYTSVSLVKFNDWLISLGEYPAPLWNTILAAHGLGGGKVHHHSNFDDVGRAAISSMQRLYPELWQKDEYMHEAADTPFGKVRTQSPVVRIETWKTAEKGWLNVTRPAGYDSPPKWEIAV